jgi:hypothetical protein
LSAIREFALVGVGIIGYSWSEIAR